jgi:hypothetical protein
MRLGEAKIREAILHPEKLVRQEAIRYFAECFSRDPDVMPVAIQAIERYGRKEAIRHVYFLSHLAQTEASVDWAIRELNHGEDRVEGHDSYFEGLSQLLCRADPRLLTSRATAIVQAPGFTRELIPDFQARLELLNWDAERCWQELETISRMGIKNSDDVDYQHADRVVEALARQGEPYADRILELLDQEVVDFETDPMSWMEIYLVMVAGEMRLKPAVPQIVRKLRAEGEFPSEACVER